MDHKRFTFLLLFLVFQPHWISGGDVICSLEDYVLTGIEFGDCQSEAMKSYGSDDDKDRNPCAELKNVVNNCARLVSRCFNERGWQRGKQVFLDLLALQYPNHNHCDIFKKNQTSNGIPEKLPGEKCTILEEVASLTQMRICNSQAQTVMVNTITHHKHVTQNLAAQNINDTKDAIIYYAYPELCKGLQNVSDTCFKNTLTECYDEHDAYFHYVYMLEELKRAGLMISIHLFPEDSNVDVLHCPVFHEASPFGQNEQLIIGLSVALSLVVFCCLVAIGMLIVHKYRIVPRFRAWIQNEPYEDIVIAESNVREMQDVTTIDDTVEVRMAAEEHLPKPEDLQNSMGVQRSRTNEESTQST